MTANLQMRQITKSQAKATNTHSGEEKTFRRAKIMLKEMQKLPSGCDERVVHILGRMLHHLEHHPRIRGAQVDQLIVGAKVDWRVNGPMTYADEGIYCVGPASGARVFKCTLVFSARMGTPGINAMLELRIAEPFFVMDLRDALESACAQIRRHSFHAYPQGIFTLDIGEPPEVHKPVSERYKWVTVCGKDHIYTTVLESPYLYELALSYIWSRFERMTVPRSQAAALLVELFPHRFSIDEDAKRAISGCIARHLLSGKFQPPNGDAELRITEHGFALMSKLLHRHPRNKG